MLAYLSRYTHRVAIPNRRLISANETGVTLKWKDYQIVGPDRYKIMTPPPHEFIRRFLIHVLPRGFHRHPSLRAACQGQSRSQHRTGARVARRSTPLDRAQYRRGRRGRRTERADASMPVLRRPHDHHRDLRARMRAESRLGSVQFRQAVEDAPRSHSLRMHLQRMGRRVGSLPIQSDRPHFGTEYLEQRVVGRHKSTLKWRPIFSAAS
jgi:hypothetical protein